MYLIFETPEDALERNIQAAKDLDFSYYKDIPNEEKDMHTLYVWGMVVEDGDNPRAALQIDEGFDLLTDEEKISIQDLPSDWHKVVAMT